MSPFVLRCLVIPVAFAMADDVSTVVPDWLKYPFFIVGAALLASAAWFLMCCCCCPIGCLGRIIIAVIFAGAIGTLAYFLFGPWWVSVNVKTIETAARSNFLF
jgi:hypothetical protein